MSREDIKALMKSILELPESMLEKGEYYVKLSVIIAMQPSGKGYQLMLVMKCTVFGKKIVSKICDKD